MIMDPQYGDDSLQYSDENATVSTTCKGCNKDFTPSTIFKHVSHRVSCKAAYSMKEIQLFRLWKRKRDKESLWESYDPGKRKKKYEKQKKLR